MELIIYQVDAFTREVFGGNPAAVIPLDEWLPDEILLAIAEENNLSETAYFVKRNGHYHLRWFTPVLEVELCGHATLASAFVLYELMGYKADRIHFDSLSGPLYVSKDNGRFVLDFPRTEMKPITGHEALTSALGEPSDTILEGESKFMVVYDQPSKVRNLSPDFTALKAIGKNAIVTSTGEDCDFISRFFAPASGIDEDPVTGSAHTALAPYWSEVLGKQTLEARQVSRRGGRLTCEMKGDRVLIKGKAKLYMTGRVEL